MRRARRWSANVVVAVGAIGVVAAADRQPGAVARGIGTLAGLVAVLAVPPAGVLVALGLILAGGGRLGRLRVGAGRRGWRFRVGRAVVEIRGLPLSAGFRLRRMPGRRWLLPVGAILGPAVVAVLPALLVPAPYRWPAAIGGGLGLTLWLLSVPGDNERAPRRPARTTPTVTWTYEEAS
jgi:hypothetical protein